LKLFVYMKKRKDQTKASSKRQVRIPTRIDELLDRYSGCLATGGDLRQRVEELRKEWR
jgi:hypothetical protein